MHDTPYRDKPKAEARNIEPVIWIKDRRDIWLLRWLWLKDFFRYGPGLTNYLSSFRERQALYARRKRDPELSRRIHEEDERKYEQGFGVTSSGYIVGSAGDFI